MKKVVCLLLGVAVLFGCKEKEGVVVRMETSEGDIRLRLYDETVLHRENMLKLVREGFYNGVLFHRVIQDFMVQAGDPDSKTAPSGVLLGEGDAGYTLKAEILPQYFHRKGVVAAAREGNAENPERNSSGSQFYIVKGMVYTPEKLSEVVEKVNERRYAALLDRVKGKYKERVEAYRAADDKEALMRLYGELTEEVEWEFAKVRMELSEEQVQAYTTVGGTPHLDGEYTVFGEVVEGMEVVEKISGVETDRNDRPVRDVVIRRMVVE